MECEGKTSYNMLALDLIIMSERRLLKECSNEIRVQYAIYSVRVLCDSKLLASETFFQIVPEIIRSEVSGVLRDTKCLPKAVMSHCMYDTTKLHGSSGISNN